MTMEESSAPAVRNAALAVALRMYAEDCYAPRASRAMRRIAADLEQGADWRSSILREGRRLPAFLRGLFLMAERTGRFAESVSLFLLVARRNRRAAWTILLATLYPLIVAGCAAMLVIGVLILIVPQFRNIFEDFGVELPLPSRVLITLSSLLLSEWHWLTMAGVGLLAGGIALCLSARFGMPAATTRTLQLVPGVGTAWWMASASEFCSLLGIAMKCQLPLPEGLRLAASSLRDSNLRAGARALADAVERGEPPHVAANALPHFRPAVAQVLRYSGEDANFAEMLRAHSELLALQSNAHSRLTVVWLEPFLMLGLGVSIGLVMYVLLLPLATLLNALA